MRKNDLSSVTDCEVIFTNGDYVILSGKNPWIFRKDGTFVAKLKSIRRAYDILFLPGNEVFLDGRADLAYHYVSLQDGRTFWSTPKSGKRDFTPYEFAASPDGRIVYHIYGIKGTRYVDVINIPEQALTTYHIPLGPGSISHCYCDADGILTILQSCRVMDTDGMTERKFCGLFGLMKWSPEMRIPIWKCQWKTGYGATPRMCDDRYVLHDDLTVLSLEHGERFDLMENSPGINRAPGGICIDAYDPERQLLTVRFLKSRSTIIIDCEKRKIISHYAPISHGLTGGCLIGDEFWIGTFDGVVRRPFPHMDKYPRML